MKTKLSALALAVALILTIGGCSMYSYNYFDGLSLPTEAERLEINSDLIEGYERTYLLCPRSLNIESAKDKGLDDNGLFGDKYFYMQAIYQKALDAYLVQKLNLQKYDDELAGHTPPFLTRTVEGHVDPIVGLMDKQTYYQRHSMMGLKYIYMSNSVHIERLSAENLALLEERYVNGQTDITPAIQAMVERTYPNIIKSSSDEELAAQGLTDESLTLRFIYSGGRVPINALVLELAVVFPDELTLLPLEQYLEIYNRIYYRFMPELAAELDGRLDIPVAIDKAGSNYFPPPLTAPLLPIIPDEDNPPSGGA